MTFYFYSLQISDLPNDVKCIVLAHGYSTASSLANVVNRMLGKNVFQAYDMPINITLDKVETKIIRYINDYSTDSGLILLVDMGSFNQLGNVFQIILRVLWLLLIMSVHRLYWKSENILSTATVSPKFMRPSLSKTVYKSN